MMFEKLTREDLAKIESYIRCYAPGDSYIRRDMSKSLQHILRFWNDNKGEYLEQLFGGQLILEKEVEYDHPRNKLWAEINKSINYGEMSVFYYNFKKAIGDKFQYNDEYYALLDLIGIDNLLDNRIRWQPEHNVVQFDTEHSLKITKGAKVMRLLGKAAAYLGLTADFEQFRLKHSLILNQKKLKGILCLSIHPLDYMTMSDNANNWTSCMNWMTVGDYRAGTVEMLNSKCVVVAYLRSDKDELRFESHSWNSKMWRSLIVVDPQIITSIKGYPYQNEHLSTTCIEWLRELGVANCGWNLTNPAQELPESEDFDFKDRTISVYYECGSMYNDFGSCTHYATISDDFVGSRTIFYSGELSCMFCGDVCDRDDDSNMVLCYECADSGCYTYCDCCGHRIYRDDAYYVDDTLMCEYCFDRNAGRCELSDEYCFNEDLETVYLAAIEDKPDEYNDYSIVVHERYLRRKDLFTAPSWTAKYFSCTPHKNADGVYYWNISDVSVQGLKNYFGMYSEAAIEEYIKRGQEEGI